ncbi:MAG: glycoside hydrolase family 27 protein, partial [Bacteroidales bacterium]|nr:glycoside hydrolase family 27 protein [Bacteroidales bacterium]
WCNFDSIRVFPQGYSQFGVMQCIQYNDTLRRYAGRGHWNDPDMLEVGNGGMNAIEDQSHFSMWCMLAAPLMAGNDLGNMNDDTKRILTNKDVIAIDQDPLGIQAHLSVAMGDRQIWVKQLADDEWAVCFFNRGDDTWDLNFNWNDIPEIRATGFYYKVYDLWQHKNIAKSTKKNVVNSIPSHGVLMVRLSPI